MRTVAVIRAVLVLDEPGGVTTPAPPDRDNIDLALDVDPWQRPQLPGTTLAGGLRAMVAAYADEDLARRLFGTLTEPTPASDTVAAVASAIWVLGTQPLPAPDGAATEDATGGDDPDHAAGGQHSDGGSQTAQASVRTEVRYVTAIDRRRGAARHQSLHSEEVLPAGTRFEVFLRWDDPDPGELDTFLAHLRRWRPLIGHAVTRGRGRAHIDAVGHHILDLHRTDHLAAWLRGHGPDLIRRLAVTPAPAAAAEAEPPATVRVPLRIDTVLRVGAGTVTDGPDGHQLSLLMRVGDRYVVPGSGLKGLLRSRCEYILRSVDATPNPCEDQRCGACWPCAVFGHGGGRNPGSGAVGRRAGVRVLDADVRDPVLVKRTHAAIDRFTGGAAPQRLYTVEALEAGTFDLVVELIDLNDTQTEQVRALLRLVLADLTDGLLGVGAGTARGYGSVTPDLDAVDLPTVDAARAVLRTMLTEGSRT